MSYQKQQLINIYSSNEEEIFDKMNKNETTIQKFLFEKNKIFSEKIINYIFDNYKDKKSIMVLLYERLTNDYIRKHLNDKICNDSFSEFSIFTYCNLNMKTLSYIYKKNILVTKENMKSILKYQSVNESFIEKKAMKLLTIEEILDSLDSNMNLSKKTLSENYFEKFKNNRKYLNIIYKYFNLSENFIEKTMGSVNISNVLLRQKFSENFLIEKIIKKYVSVGILTWENISGFPNLSEKFIHTYKDKLNWNILCQKQRMSEKFLMEHQMDLKMDLKENILEVLKFQDVSDEYIKKQIEEMKWTPNIISIYDILYKKNKNKELIKYIKNRINEKIEETKENKALMSIAIPFFNKKILLNEKLEITEDLFFNIYKNEREELIKYQTLTKEFIEINKNKLSKKDWNYISKYQKLSEDFILKYSSKVNWLMISQYQNLTVDFVSKNEKKISYSHLFLNKKYQKNYIKENLQKLEIDKEKKEKVQLNFEINFY